MVLTIDLRENKQAIKRPFNLNNRNVLNKYDLVSNSITNYNHTISAVLTFI